MTSLKSGAFTLWPHSETAAHSLRLDIQAEQTGKFQQAGRNPADLFAMKWLERFEGFDYGAMTAWLMRACGHTTRSSTVRDGHYKPLMGMSSRWNPSR